MFKPTNTSESSPTTTPTPPAAPPTPPPAAPTPQADEPPQQGTKDTQLQLVPDEEFRLMYKSIIQVLRAQRHMEKGPNIHITLPALNFKNTTLGDKTCTALINLREQQANDTLKLFDQSIALAIKEAQEAVDDIRGAWVLRFGQAMADKIYSSAQAIAQRFHNNSNYQTTNPKQKGHTILSHQNVIQIYRTKNPPPHPQFGGQGHM